MDHFLAGMHGQGIRLAARMPEGIQAAHIDLAERYDALGWMRSTCISEQHIRCGAVA